MKPDIPAVSVGFTSTARVPPSICCWWQSVPEHICCVLDLRLKPADAFVTAMAEFGPDVVRVTAYSAVVMGGYHATMATAAVLTEPAVTVADGTSLLVHC